MYHIASSVPLPNDTPTPQTGPSGDFWRPERLGCLHPSRLLIVHGVTQHSLAGDDRPMTGSLFTPHMPFHKKSSGAAALSLALLGLAACQPAPASTALPHGLTPPSSTPAATTETPSASSPQRSKLIGMANPASVHCVNAGGKLEIRTGSSGGQYGVCHMPDGTSCEEWSFFRTGQCKAETLQNR